MDELKIKSKLLRAVISKIIGSIIKKKLGYKIDIQINDIDVTIKDGKAHVHLDTDAEMDETELLKITKVIGV